MIQMMKMWMSFNIECRKVIFVHMSWGETLNFIYQFLLGEWKIGGTVIKIMSMKKKLLFL